MLEACFFYMLAQMFQAPKLRFITHRRKIKLLKFLLLLLHMTANITGISKHLRQNRMYLDLNIPAPKYLITSLQRPIKRRHQYYIDFLILEHFLGPFALLHTLFSDVAIDELFGVWYFFVEVIELDAFLPADIEVMLFFVVQEALVEFGLGVAD